MRILYCLNSGQIGGMEQHVLDLVTGMSKRGFAVWVICPDGLMVKRFEAAGATAIIDQIRFDLDPFYICRLVKFLRASKINIIHGHELKAGLNALIAGKIAGTPLKIIHIHTPISQWQISPLKKKLDILVNRFISNKLADRVIALTESVKAEKIKNEGIEPGKIVVIPNGVIINSVETHCNASLQDRMATSSKIFVVGSLGRLTEEKGFPVLLTGFELFLKNYKELPLEEWPRLIIGGAGPLDESLKNQARDLGIGRLVAFSGLIPPDKKFDFLSQLDVFVFPSLAEGFGIVLLEAMSCGLPCLVSDLPVLQEVGANTVLTFNTSDPADLATKLYDLYKDSQLRQDLGQKARARVANTFTLENFWDSYASLYTKPVVL